MKPPTTITLNCQVRQSVAEPIRRDMAHEKVVNIYTSLDLTLAHAFFWHSSKSPPIQLGYIPGCSTAHLLLHQSLDRWSRLGTTDDFTTSFLHFCFCSPLPFWTWHTPGLSIPWFCLPASFKVCLVFSPLSLCFAKWFWPDWWTRDMCIPLQCWSLYDGREVFVWSDCLLDLGTDFLVGNMVFVWDAWYLAVACILLFSSAVKIHDSQA